MGRTERARLDSHRPLTITTARTRIRSELRRRLGPLYIDETALAFQVLRKQDAGLMLDVGAHYGESLGRFADTGWSVHAFEPDSENRHVLEAEYGAYPRVQITATAVADEPGEMPLFTSEESSGISSLAGFHESHTPGGVVEVTTLSTYLDAHDISAVDLLKIDVEGFEREVLQGHDWGRRPRVVVAEFEDRKTLPRGYAWTDLADLLEGKGLRVLVSEWAPIVEYGADHEWRAFKPYPCALENEDGWGNLIAVEPALWPLLRAAARRMRLMAFIGRRRGRH